MAGKIESFKKVLAKHPLWTSGVSILVTLLFVAWRILPLFLTPTVAVEPIPKTWFYEMDSGKLFVHDDIEPKLVKGPSGGASLRAMVFACGDCSVAEKRFAGWLENEEWAEGTEPAKPDQARFEWREARETTLTETGEFGPIKLRIRGVEETEWSPRIPAAVQNLTQAATDRCKHEAGDLTPCPVAAAKP